MFFKHRSVHPSPMVLVQIAGGGWYAHAGHELDPLTDPERRNCAPGPARRPGEGRQMIFFAILAP